MRTSWQKYLPPNWAPMPVVWASAQHLLLEVDVAETVPAGASPRLAGCRGSRADASLAVSSAISADVPPITIARWYGGQAAVPSVCIFSKIHGSRVASLSSALVSWNR